MMNEDQMTTVVVLRLAEGKDLPAVQTLMHPFVLDGTLRPRDLRVGEVIVAEVGGQLLGCVALSSWTSDTWELGSLVSTQRGLGGALVQSALAHAHAQGIRRVVCITGVERFFARQGFSLVGTGVPPHRQPDTGCAAIRWKAARCRLCPDAQNCNQSLMEYTA
ncbi:MAG: GNAT family N-acetyltransferase [Myxococcota bacterium]|nr:GNAT family N-acetyltransferase [Myxococcota bacterium]